MQKNDSTQLIVCGFVLLLLSVWGSVGHTSDLGIVNADVRVAESDGIANVTIQLTSIPTSTTRVSWSTRFGSAISGKDYTSKSGRMSFLPGQATANIQIPIVDDDIDEHDQFFNIFFRNPSGLSIEENTKVRVFIEDDDPEPTIGFRLDNLPVDEGTGGITKVDVPIILSHRSEKVIQFTVYTAINTASLLEFEYVAERVTYGAAGLAFNYPVGIIADAELEGRQQFYLYLRNPRNAAMDEDDLVGAMSDRIRTKLQILDDDVLQFAPDIDSANSFAWMGTFGRRFTAFEQATLASNSSIVVLAKFHANFDIAVHHDEAAQLKALNPTIRVFPYFNSKYWFVESKWSTQPPDSCLLHDDGGELIVIDTDRSAANILDLRKPVCHDWILSTVASWMDTELYDGIAFDSTGPVGDVGEGVYWQDILGGQAEVDLWNEGMKFILTSAAESHPVRQVLFNGIGPAQFRGESRDLFQLEYTDGALNESFAVDLDGNVRDSLREDINLMSGGTEDVFLMKTNIRDSGDEVEIARLGRFSYGAFLMGWMPGKSYYKFAVDDFYTSAELDDYPEEQGLELGQPLSVFQEISDLFYREFENATVLLNPTKYPIEYFMDGHTVLVPAEDMVFID